jgi:hypothetical protein
MTPMDRTTGDVGDAPEAQPLAERGSRSRASERKPLDAARKAAVNKRAARTPESARGTYLRAATGQASPRDAIKAFCFECNGEDRQAVAECTALACPLWAYRPWQRSQQAIDEHAGPSGIREASHRLAQEARTRTCANPKPS